MAAGVTAGLGEWDLQDGNGYNLNGHVFDTRSIANFNSLAGGLTSSAVEYGLTGRTTFNVARLSGTTNGNDWGYGLMG